MLLPSFGSTIQRLRRAKHDTRSLLPFLLFDAYGSLIPYCLWIHVVFAFYMYGNGSVFPGNTAEGESDQQAASDNPDTFDFAAKLEVKVQMCSLFRSNGSRTCFKPQIMILLFV